MAPVNRHLIEKIGTLPAERIAEVENFVELLRRREQEASALPLPEEATGIHGFAEAPSRPEDGLGRARVRRDPDVMMGKSIIGGTRITVEHILRLLGAGDTTADILRNHPQLAEADIHAAQAYAADVLAHESISAAR